MPRTGRWLAVFALIGLASTAFGSRVAHAEEELRIALLEDAKEIAISGDDLALWDATSGASIAELAGSSRLRLSPSRKGVSIAVVAGSGLRDDTDIAHAPSILIEGKGAIRVEDGMYLGRVEVSLNASGRLLTINRLPLELYLLGIVGSEMNAGWPIEALKAQAVAARTYAMQRRIMMRAANRPFDLGATVLSQVYKGADRIRPSVIRAVKETRGEVMSFRHDMVEALFHSTCGGETVASKAVFGRSIPYLASRPCKWCRDSERHHWKLRMPLSEMSAKLVRAKLVRSRIRGFSRNDRRGAVSVLEGKKRRSVSATEVREAVGYSVLFSDRFTAETKGSVVVIEGSGFGHGVGMCQWGARGMALEGKTHVEILGHYYPNIRVQRIY